MTWHNIAKNKYKFSLLIFLNYDYVLRKKNVKFIFNNCGRQTQNTYF